MIGQQHGALPTPTMSTELDKPAEGSHRVRHTFDAQTREHGGVSQFYWRGKWRPWSKPL